MMKKWIVLCLVLLLSLCGVALGEEASAPVETAAAEEAIPMEATAGEATAVPAPDAAIAALTEQGYLPIAENDRLALLLAADSCGFSVVDKASGVTWSSSMNDPTFTGKLAGLNAKKANSLLTINVTNLEKGAGSITNAVLLNEKNLTTAYELIENGVRLDYDLGNTQISLSVEVVLDGEDVVVRVPYSSINAYGEFSIVSIDMLPYLCSGSDNADGFLLYPDGSGAILEFKDYAHYRELTQLFSVYGNTEKAQSMLDFFDQEDPEVFMPVYGVSIAGNAMLAVVEDGAQTARISVNSSNKIVAVSNVFANLQYRRGFDDLRVTTRSIKTYDPNAMETDYSIRLMFLPAGEDSYSDMAVAYRKYLMKNGLEPDIAEQSVALDLFMSAPEKGLLFDTQRTVTTLEQAGGILDALEAAGIGGAQVSLKGWAKGGYGMFPDRLPVDGAIGSNDDLAALAKKAADMGSTLSVTANFIEANADSRNYSKRNDVVYLSSYAILTDPEETTFILSPEVTREKYDAFVKAGGNLGLGGMRFERMGQFIPFNYNRGHYYTTEQTLEVYKQMLADAKETFGSASVEGGAIWAAPYVQLFTRVPYEASGYQFTTKAVPFFQIAMHGLRSYTGEPGNLSSDLQREMLRWVELGYMPYFELTWGSTEALMYTEYQSLFTAEYTAWLDEVAQVAREFGEGELSELRTAMITAHEQIAPDVYRVRYDNGTAVYVNYSQDSVEADGHTVPGMDYLVVKEGSK